MGRPNNGKPRSQTLNGRADTGTGDGDPTWRFHAMDLLEQSTTDSWRAAPANVRAAPANLREPEISVLSHPRLVPRPPREMPRGTEPAPTQNEFAEEPTT